MDEFYQAIQRLPQDIQSALASILPNQAKQIYEIRLRSNRPIVCSTAQGPQLAEVLTQGKLTRPLSHSQLQECFYDLCQRSVHSYEQQLNQGFITLPGGHRVGIAGIFHRDQGKLRGIQTITSLNIRIARAVYAVLPVELEQNLTRDFAGMLLIGPPGSGKTTLLRTLLSSLSGAGRKTAVADERQELWPCGPQGFCTPVPLHCDVISGCQKQMALAMALRCLGPEILACDELGGLEEWSLMKQCSAAGVQVLCTIHGSGVGDALNRLDCTPQELASCFRVCVVLKPGAPAGRIQEIIPL